MNTNSHIGRQFSREAIMEVHVTDHVTEQLERSVEYERERFKLKKMITAMSDAFLPPSNERLAEILEQEEKVHKLR